MERLEQALERPRPLRKGQVLFEAGTGFHSLYAVRSGAFKSFTINNEGEERILGFHLPGELLGLDAIYPKQHQCTAEALDTASVCRLPFERLTDIASEFPSLQQQIYRLLSRELTLHHDFPDNASAEQRVAWFLIQLGDRLASRGYSGTRFVLTMSRRDIAKYLTITPETISRVLGRFQEQHLIAVERRDVELLNSAALRTLCIGGDTEDSSCGAKRA
jgi:CRP/FNR family transcriptional regulator